jgi:hypothetical protein
MQVIFKRPDGTFVIQRNGYPYHVIPADPLFLEVQARGGNAPLEPEMPPVVLQATQITFAQLLIGLVAEGWITEAQGDDWLAGKLPPPVVALIGALPANRRFAAKARAARPSVVLRADPLVNALAQARGLTAEQLDAFFATYSQV